MSINIKTYIMKNILLLLSLIFTLSLFSIENTLNSDVISSSIDVVETDYCEGWEDGYCEGWKDVKGQYSICPITPICPIAKLECSEGYKCGYNRGFKAGIRAARK